MAQNLVNDNCYQGRWWKGIFDEHVVEDVGVGLLGHGLPIATNLGVCGDFGTGIDFLKTLGHA